MPSNTPVLELPYPPLDGHSVTPDVPRDINALAVAVENAFGLGTFLARAPTSAAQTPASATRAVMPNPYNNEEFDVSGWYDTATGKFSPLQKGIYLLRHQMVVTTTAAGDQIEANVFKNGSVARVRSRIVAGTTEQAVDVTTLLAANGTTDYFEPGGFSTTQRVLENGSAFAGFFMGYLVRPQS